MLEMIPSEAKKFITNALMIRKIPYIAGPPGIGKSDLMVQIADEFNLKLLDIRLSQKLPEDLTGLPIRNDAIGKAEYVPFDTFPMEGDEIPEGYDGWLVFLDELSSASDEVWSAIYSLLLGHTVGGRRLHSKALITAAGNRASDSALARPLPDTLITRLLCANMKVSVPDWLKWAEKPVNKINQAVIDHITKNPDHLMSLIPQTNREELECYGTPRGWETVSLFTNLHEKVNKGVLDPLTKVVKPTTIPEDIAHNMYAAVGFMEAKAYIEHFNEQMVVPYPFEVAQSASSIRIPTSAIARAELTQELAKFFMESGAQTREALLVYMNRNNSESRALFTSLIKEALGETVSDIALLDDINKRLAVTNISDTQAVSALAAIQPSSTRTSTHDNKGNPLPNSSHAGVPITNGIAPDGSIRPPNPPSMQVQPDGTSIVDHPARHPDGDSDPVMDDPFGINKFKISKSNTGPLFHIHEKERKNDY